MRNIIKANKEYIFTHTEEKTVENALNFRRNRKIRQEILENFSKKVKNFSFWS